MNVTTKKMCIFGKTVDVSIYTDTSGREWVRFSVNGSWMGPQDIGQVEKNMLVKENKDGSIDVFKQELIPAERATDAAWLYERTDIIINEIEDALGFDANSLSSSANNVGHYSADMDVLMTDTEQKIVAGTV